MTVQDYGHKIMFCSKAMSLHQYARCVSEYVYTQVHICL